ncbi:endonuclease-like protein, partial [Nannochloropsis gaditana CCMP526]
RIAILEVDTFDRASLTRVGGLDLSFFPSSHGHEREEAVACFVVLSYPSLEVLHESYLPTTLTIPYVAGFLAYREGPPMAQLVEELRRTQPTL